MPGLKDNLDFVLARRDEELLLLAEGECLLVGFEVKELSAIRLFPWTTDSVDAPLVKGDLG